MKALAKYTPSERQRRFYNDAYSPLRKHAADGRLFRILQRFELHRTDAVLQLLPTGGKLLDVGCGNGSLAVRCAPLFDHVTGLDIADVQVKHAQARARDFRTPNVSFLTANLDEHLPFQDEYFHAITAVAVLAQVFDPVATLAELHRVLRRRGQLIVEVPNLAYLPRRLALLSGHMPLVSTGPGWNGAHLHDFTLAALQSLLHQQGFFVERSTGSGLFAKVRAWWPSLLTGNLIVVCRKATTDDT